MDCWIRSVGSSGSRLLRRGLGFGGCGRVDSFRGRFRGRDSRLPRATSVDGCDAFPRLATDGSGTWVTVWHSHDGEGVYEGDIAFSRSTDLGETWSGLSLLDANFEIEEAFDDNPAIASAGEGQFMVVWESSDSEDSPLGSDFDTLWARSTDGANTFGSPQALLVTAATDGIDDGAPDLLADGVGGYFVVVQTGDDAKALVGSRFSAGADVWSPHELVGMGSTGAPELRLATDGVGHWMYAYFTWEFFGGDGDIVMSYSLDDTRTWTFPAVIDQGALTDDLRDAFPTVATDGRGTWVAAWTTRSFFRRIKIATSTCP